MSEVKEKGLELKEEKRDELAFKIFERILFTSRSWAPPWGSRSKEWPQDPDTHGQNLPQAVDKRMEQGDSSMYWYWYRSRESLIHSRIRSFPKLKHRIHHRSWDKRGVPWPGRE